MTTVNPLLVTKLRRLGIKMPVRMILAARWAKCPLPIACTILMMETGGGRNVFGHDPTIFTGVGDVTRKNYRAYRAMRKLTGACQGVGPCQLTYFAFQDKADKLGGCEKPLCNMKVGFGLIVSHVRRYGMTEGFAAYNGSGPAAEAYGRRARAIHQHFVGELLGWS